MNRLLDVHSLFCERVFTFGRQKLIFRTYVYNGVLWCNLVFNNSYNNDDY